MKDGWFKFYSGFRNDPRLRRMPVECRYAFVVLLCLANENSRRGHITGLDDDDLAFELEMELDEWLLLKARLASKGFIRLDSDDSVIIVDWHSLYRGAQQYGQDGRPPIALWLKLREIVFERDGYTCQYCGYQGDDLHCDHIYPVSRGGSNDLDNLTTACASCNLSKHSKTPEEWLGGSL